MINIIVAYAHHRVIGYHGCVPWYLPRDLQHFRYTTLGRTVVMGHKTFESIRKPLVGRRNIVLTHQQDLMIPGIEVIHDAEQVMDMGDVFIIGGETLYRQFLEYAMHLYITEVDLETKGDTFFPEWDAQAFTLVSHQKRRRDPKNHYDYTFLHYQRLCFFP